MTLRLGFVGLGNMGRPIAENIARAGHHVVGFDAAGTETRVPDGIEAASSLDDIWATCESVLFSVPDGAASSALVEQLATADARRVTTVIDLSTIGPVVARACAARLAPLGISYCDGPVSGGVAGARSATISLMFAGPVDVLEAHRPVLDAMAGNVFHVGLDAGQGQVMKLVTNFLSAVALAATSEAIALGQAYGLDMQTMLDVVNVSSGRNTASADKFPNRVVTGTYDAGFHTRLMTKDVALFLAAVDEAGTRDVVARAVGDVWQAADASLPGSDFTEIWKYVSRSDGTAHSHPEGPQ